MIGAKDFASDGRSAMKDSQPVKPKANMKESTLSSAGKEECTLESVLG